MTEQNFELIHNTLEQANSILIPIPEVQGEEILGSALALAYLLKSEGKNVEILSSYVNLQKILTILDLSSVTSVIQSSTESIISIDTTQYPIDSIKYDQTESQLRIYLSSPSDKFRPEMVSIYPAKYNYDLILTIDTKNWTQLGNSFLSYPHIFLGTPSLAISTIPIPHPYSERTVTVENYSNSAEIIFEYMYKYSKHSLNEKPIVNALLLSLILSSNKTLALEKTIIKLRELPNDYNFIINTLDNIITDNHRLLIGRILAHLEFIEFEYKEKNIRYACSKLFHHDFNKTNTTEQDIIMIFRELFKYLPKNILGLNLIFESSKNNKKSYLNFPQLDITSLYTELEGEYIEGVLVYNYASDKDIHLASKEINNKIISLLNS
jgi:nanoRNase/pAp phosphatase (c-di-AMP/oligoRNAs hydrolase)